MYLIGPLIGSVSQIVTGVEMLGVVMFLTTLTLGLPGSEQTNQPSKSSRAD